MMLYRSWRSLISRFALLLALSCAVFSASSFADGNGQRAEIRGMDMSGYGRVILNFQHLPKSDVTIKNSILIWTFDIPVQIRVDKLPVELSQYIAGARLDPDGKTLRLALAQTLRFNLQDAGDDYYLDLLPKSWTAANPSIPAEIVRDLSRRVREAEADLRARDAALIRPIEFDSAEGNSLSLFRITAPDPDAISIIVNNTIVELRINGRYKIDEKKLVSSLPNAVRFVRAEQAENEFRVFLDIGNKLNVKSYRDDRILVLEFHPRNSGSLDINGIGNFRQGEWTGSVAEPEAQDKKPQTNRMTFTQEGDTEAVIIETDKDYPIASYVADGKIFFLVATDEKFEIQNHEGRHSSAIDKVVPLGAAEMKGFVISLKSPRFPRIDKQGNTYRLSLLTEPQADLQEIDFVALPGKGDEMRVVMALADAAIVMNVQDPDTGASFLVVPSRSSGLGFKSRYRFQEFALEASAQGLAIRKHTDDIIVNFDAGAVVISRPRGLNGFAAVDHVNQVAGQVARSFIKAQYYNLDHDADPLKLIRSQIERVIAADPKDLFAARVRLARIYAALNLFPEAAGIFQRALTERVSARLEPQDEIELLLYRTLSGETYESFARLSQSDMNAYPDAALLLAYHHARQGRMSEALAAYRASGSVLASYPSGFVRHILPVLAEAAIEAQDANLSSNLVTALVPYVEDGTRDAFRYLSARYLDLAGQKDDAAAILSDLVHSSDRRVSVRARLADLMRDQTDTQDAILNRLAQYQGLQTIWRGDWLEARIIMELAKLSFKGGEWRRGFLAMQAINRDYAEAPGARTLLDTATSQLELVFDERSEPRLGAVEAVSLFMDFREFMPVGRRGDEVIRKLTDKLVDLDLLAQASELMLYQIENRLEGLARAQASPRLAYIYLLDKRPKDALAILNETRMTGLSEDLQRSRMLLEARSRADLGDKAGAYEVIEALNGEDVARLRAEIAWRAKDWKQAAELSELVIGDEWKAPEAFQNESAFYALRAAIGYALNSDRISLDRIRARYVKKFGDRPDAAAFRFLTAPTSKGSPFESEYAATYKGGSTIDGFMKFYRETYLDKPLAQKQANASPG